MGDNRVIHAIGRGDIIVKVQGDPDTAVDVSIAEVLYVPNMGVNLLSVSRMVRSGLNVSFTDDECVIAHKSGKVLARTRSGTGNLYRLFLCTYPTKHFYYCLCWCFFYDAKLWHDRLGHLHLDSMKALKNRSLVNDFTVGNISNELELKAISQCEACIKGKSHRAAMPFAATHRATRLLELTDSDLCGPMASASFNGARYFLTFIDDYSRFTVVKLLKTKDEVMQHFIRLSESG